MVRTPTPYLGRQLCEKITQTIQVKLQSILILQQNGKMLFPERLVSSYIRLRLKVLFLPYCVMKLNWCCPLETCILSTWHSMLHGNFKNESFPVLETFPFGYSRTSQLPNLSSNFVKLWSFPVSISIPVWVPFPSLYLCNMVVLLN